MIRLLTIFFIIIAGISPIWTSVSAFEYLQALPVKPLVPADNPMSKPKARLGKMLFYDTALSADNTFSCNRCHNLLSGGDDDQAFSVGASGQPTQRSSPTLWNIGLQTVLQWDGRYKTLEEQAIAHLLDPNIMAAEKNNLLTKLAANKTYKTTFKKVFGGNQSISLANIAKALACFERELMSPNSPFDRYIGGNKQALTELAVRGINTFNTAGCLACHFGVNFAGPAPGPAMTIGDGFYELFPNTRDTKYELSHNLLKDRGRYEFTKNTNEIYMWRVPPLRNIALTAPYFHNGSAKTLREAVNIMAKTQFNNDITEQEIDELTAFLQSLTGEVPDILTNSKW